MLWSEPAYRARRGLQPEPTQCRRQGDVATTCRARQGGLSTYVQAFTRIHAKNMRKAMRPTETRGDRSAVSFQNFFARWCDFTSGPARALAYRSLAEEMLWAPRALDEGGNRYSDAVYGMRGVSVPQ